MNSTALKLYPLHTNAEIKILIQADTAQQQYIIAQDIIKRNEYISITYAAKANYEYSRGNIEEYISFTNRAIALSPYDIELYNDYGAKLIGIYNLYTENGDFGSAEYCFKQLVKLKKQLIEVEEKTSPLAWKIKDTPQLELSPIIIDFIKTKTEE